MTAARQPQIPAEKKNINFKPNHKRVSMINAALTPEQACVVLLIKPLTCLLAFFSYKLLEMIYLSLHTQR